MAGEGTSGTGFIPGPKLFEQLGKLIGGKPDAPRNEALVYARRLQNAVQTFERTGKTSPILPTGLNRENVGAYAAAIAREVLYRSQFDPYGRPKPGARSLGEVGTPLPRLRTSVFGPTPSPRPSRVYSTAPRSGQPPPVPGAPGSWEEALWQLAEGGLQWWLEHRQARDVRQAAKQQARALQRWLQSLGAQVYQGVTGGNMPYPVTSFVGGGGGGSFWDALLGGLSGATRALLPAGSGGDLGYDVPYFPDVLVPDVIQRGMATSGAVGGPFAVGGTTVRARKFLLPDPNGRLHWFGPLGEPILWSRDFSTVRRVRKVGAKARRWCGRAGGR